MTQFPGLSLRKVDGAGHFSPLLPTLGIPRLWAPGSRWELEGSSLPKAGGSLEPNPRRQGLSGSSAGLKARSPPLQVTSSGLAGCGRRAPGPLSGGGEGQGWGAGETAPPAVNRRFRAFFTRPTPFLPLPSRRRVPVRPPLPAPSGRRSLHLCRKWEKSRGHAESESPVASLSLVPGLAGLSGSQSPAVSGSTRNGGRAAGRELQGPDWRWTPALATPREPRADSFHDVPVGAAAAPPAQRPGQ